MFCATNHFVNFVTQVYLHLWWCTLSLLKKIGKGTKQPKRGTSKLLILVVNLSLQRLTPSMCGCRKPEAVGNLNHALVKWQFYIVLLPPQNGQQTDTKGSWSPANPWITFENCTDRPHWSQFFRTSLETSAEAVLTGRSTMTWLSEAKPSPDFSYFGFKI